MKELRADNTATIAIVICYFGELPWYFDYFIHSCRYNPTIDFFIITDEVTCNTNIPPNVKFIYKTLNDISKIASEKLGFPVNIKYGYKLCDFKPAYGLLFSDLVAEYDFWGHSDIDIIFGNIRNFISHKVLSTHDVISFRPDWLSGCFLLFKNTERMRMLFSLSKDYKKVFCSDTHYCFDETNFSHQEFTDGKRFSEVKTEIESMMHVVQRLEEENYLKAYFDLHMIEGTPGRLKWTEGTLVYRNRYEVLLYHMIFFKHNYKKRMKRDLPKAFSISPRRIHHKEELYG